MPGRRARASIAATRPSLVNVGGMRTSTMATSTGCSVQDGGQRGRIADLRHHVEVMRPQQPGQPVPEQR